MLAIHTVLAALFVYLTKNPLSHSTFRIMAAFALGYAGKAYSVGQGLPKRRLPELNKRNNNNIARQGLK
jgi:hypothetical protein